MTVTKLPEGIIFRKCPGCGFVETQRQIDAAKINMVCPECKKYYFSDFVPLTFNDPPPPKPRARKVA